MRRLLQLSTLVLILTVVLTPISEALDRWDTPGLSHDTEFAVFAFVLCIALVLLVSQLVAMARQVIPLVSEAVMYLRYTMHFPSMVALRVGCVCMGLSPPLRI